MKIPMERSRLADFMALVLSGLPPRIPEHWRETCGNFRNGAGYFVCPPQRRWGEAAVYVSNRRRGNNLVRFQRREIGREFDGRQERLPTGRLAPSQMNQSLHSVQRAAGPDRS